VSPINISNMMKVKNTPAITTPGKPNYDFVGAGPKSHEMVVEKKYYDAFAQTKLSDYLRSKDIKNVVLVGGYASRCVLGTAFGANGNDFEVVAVADLMINTFKISKEKESSLSIINAILGYVITEDELRNLF